MKIAIIGAGNMGMSYARSLLQQQQVKYSEVVLVESRQDTHPKLIQEGFLNLKTSVDDSLIDCDIILLAVKPQDFPAVATSLRHILTASNVVFSIMAGIKISSLEDSLKHRKIIRAMPNTPAQIGMGVTAYVASQHCETNDISLAQEILSSTGEVLMLHDESLLDAVTALSGSGPAYFYYILKAIITAGKEMGLESDTATLLAKQTMIGTYHLFNQSNATLDELIQAVASKGGTTEAALRTFDEQNVANGIVKGILNAQKRSQELSNAI